MMKETKTETEKNECVNQTQHLRKDEQENYNIGSTIFGKTRRDRLKSAPYLRLKNIQRTTIGNIWKNYFFQKKF